MHSTLCLRKYISVTRIHDTLVHTCIQTFELEIQYNLWIRYKLFQIVIPQGIGFSFSRKNIWRYTRIKIFAHLMEGTLLQCLCYCLDIQYHISGYFRTKKISNNCSSTSFKVFIFEAKNFATLIAFIASWIMLKLRLEHYIHFF